MLPAPRQMMARRLRRALRPRRALCAGACRGRRHRHAHDIARRGAGSQVGSGRKHQGGGDAPGADCSARKGRPRPSRFIDACYRTHSLSSDYTKAFEACIAQDYLETQILALIYSRMSPEALKRTGAPTPQMLAETMSRRVSGAFAQYKISKEQIADVQAQRRRARLSAVLPVAIPRRQDAGSQDPEPVQSRFRERSERAAREEITTWPNLSPRATTSAPA